MGGRADVVGHEQTYYDFEGKYGFHDANFIIHPEDFYVSCPLS